MALHWWIRPQAINFTTLVNVFEYLFQNGKLIYIYTWQLMMAFEYLDVIFRKVFVTIK